ncbi:MAG: ankyrin repeat domain-containing protein [Bacteroidota bacterium]
MQAAPSASQALTPKAARDTEGTNQYEISGVVLTSSSDSSPDAKHTDSVVSDRDGQDQPMASTPQGHMLAHANADNTMTEAKDRGVARKRPATAQLHGTVEQQVVTKQARSEISSPLHQKWFTAFTQAAAQIGEDPKDEAAWDNMEHVLDEGEKNDFLAASITWANDSDSSTHYEYTPLHYAAARGMLELVKELTEQRSVRADLQTNAKKNTPLHMAAAGGHLDVVAYLVKEKRLDISTTDDQGASALHYASAGIDGENNRDVIAYLVAEIKEEEVMKCTNDNLSVLELAVHADNIQVVKYWVTKLASRHDDTARGHIANALKMAKAMPGREAIASIIEGSSKYANYK